MTAERPEKHPGGRPRKSCIAPAEPANKVYYTTKEAAALTGLCTRTIRERIKDGTINAKRVSGHWKIYRSSIYNGKDGGQ